MYVKEAISSILHQTFSNFELIIVNDGSTDSTLDLIKSFSDERIKIIDQENHGLAYSLNKGIEHSQGKYIARIDADDICLANRLEIQYDCMEKYPEVDVLGGAVNYINEKGDYLGRSFPVTNSRVIKYFIENKGNVVAHPTVMVRKQAFTNYGLYYADLKFKQDYHLWCKFLRKGAIIKNIPNVLINYRISENSIGSKYPITPENKHLFKMILMQDQPDKDLIQELIKSMRSSVNANKKRINKVVGWDFQIYKQLGLVNLYLAETLVIEFKNLLGMLHAVAQLK